ncbi:MAG: type II secretion system F family protein [Pirellulales bacterium]|nr:type II secretion system F family protein [Pirellulales bacterium]
MNDIVSTLFSPRIRTKELAQLCRRLATSLAAGIDLRTIWNREASASGRSVLVSRFGVIRDAVAAGASMADGIDECGNFFPPLFRQLTRVGDETGSGAEVFRQLAEHYDAGLKRRRIFLAAISWPVLELVAAVVVIGLFIWILGMVGNGKTDMLGFGLIGTRGLVVYVVFLCGVGIVCAFLFQAFRRGVMWIRPMQRAVLKIPVLRKPLETLALSRLAWVMHLTMSTGMDVRRAMRLSLESTNHAQYLDHVSTVDRWIAQGGSIHEAFVEAGGYPAEFLDTLQVGEESGRMVESMRNLSEQYQDRARVALAALMTIAGFAVWALVALLIAVMIIRIFMTAYLGPINDALKM